MPNKYAQIPEGDPLDLHGKTKSEAELELKIFLNRSESEGKSLVRVITGKGLHSENGPVLKNFVRDWLREKDYEFRDVKIGEGYGGAFDIKI